MSKRNSVSRRQFLKGAAAAAAAAAVGPYFITSQALGGAGRASASNRLTVAHIGIGNRGRDHFNDMLGRGDGQIVAVCDVKKTVRDDMQNRVNTKYAADRTAGTYKGCDAYNDYRELLPRTDIDSVVIGVPPHWHAIIAIDSARAGKDIYCEKPMALTIRQARAMVNAVRRYGRVFQNGSQQRSDDRFRKACELVRNGRIGTVKSIYVNVAGPSTEKQFTEQPVPAGFDWNMWLGPAPWSPYNAERCSGDYGGGWRFVRDYSGGMMCDWGAHHYDIAQWGLGMDNSGPVEINPPDGKDYRTLTYKYANGTVMYHGAKPGGSKGIYFVGSKGDVEVDRGYFKSYPDAIGNVPIGPTDINLYKSNNHMSDWMSCIRTRRRPICDVEIGCRTVTVCHLGNIAYWTGRPFKWDPVKEEIIGDAEAARWLDRPMRAPWRLLEA
jgi:predicted dehydrogenase